MEHTSGGGLAAIRFLAKARANGALRIEIRFTSADSGFELDLSIAADGNLSAGPVSPGLLQPEKEIR
jgi:hypothetical protein